MRTGGADPEVQAGMDTPCAEAVQRDASMSEKVPVTEEKQGGPGILGGMLLKKYSLAAK